MKLAKLSAVLLLGTTSYLAYDKTKTYVWGNGFYQALPGQGMSFANFIPQQLLDFDNLKQLYFSDHFEAGLSQKGEAFVWDKHSLCSSQSPEVNDSKRQNIVKLKNPSKSEIKEIKFTRQFVWTLNGAGEVHQYPIENKKLVNNPKLIQSLKNIQQIDTGEDHFVALTEDGEILTMGDDTLGQCGQGHNKRSTAPPFYEARVRTPGKLSNLPPISKIVCGSNHTLVISRDGAVYGWGSNSQMQLSHMQEFSKVAEPVIAIYNPVRISSLMDSNNSVTDAAAGNEFSLFVTTNKQSQETEVFGCGHNIRGQLGAGFGRHVSDIVKIEGLSNFKIEVDGKQEHVRIKQIQCGLNHCMALTNVGAILEWGDNEYGQLGNKKRSFSDKPIVMSYFVKDKLISIGCGHNSSGVVVQ